jgi:hypothetical protein
MPTHRKLDPQPEELVEVIPTVSPLDGFEFYHPTRRRAASSTAATATILRKGTIILSPDLAEKIVGPEGEKGYVQLGYNPTLHQILIRPSTAGEYGVLRVSRTDPRSGRFRVNAQQFLGSHNLLLEQKAIYTGAWNDATQGIIITLT